MAPCSDVKRMICTTSVQQAQSAWRKCHMEQEAHAALTQKLLNSVKSYRAMATLSCCWVSAAALGWTAAERCMVLTTTPSRLGSSSSESAWPTPAHTSQLSTINGSLEQQWPHDGGRTALHASVLNLQAWRCLCGDYE